MKTPRKAIYWLGALVALLVGAAPVMAQETGSVAGVVRSEAGEPIAGAQVNIIGTNVGTVTQENGRYLIREVPAGNHEIQVQLIGYGTETRDVTVAAGETVTLNITLSSEAIALDEIVVTGVSGATVRAKVPFDIGTVNAADMPVPSVSAGSAIQGKVAGAQVVQGSGRPGSAPSILLRGATSISAQGRSQEPLYIVDGVILSSTMVDIDGLDIENIEIVKGAAAASLYGSRAANGVIQIQTRRGTAVEQNSVRYTIRSEGGQSSMPNTPDVLVAELHPFEMRDGQLVDANTGETCDWHECTGLAYAGSGVWDTYQTNEYPGQSFDQVDRFFDSGTFMQNYIAGSGRSGRTNFHVSYSNVRDQGVLPGLDGLTRNNFRVNVDQSVRENFSVTASAFYSRSDSDVFPEASGNPMFTLTRTRAATDLTACEDDRTQSCLDRPEDLILQTDPFNTEAENPLYELHNREYTEQRSRFLGSASLRYSPIDWFDVDATASFDRLDAEEEDLFPQGFRTVVASSQLNEGYLDRYFDRREGLNASVTGTFRFDLTDDIANRTQFRYLYEQDDRSWNFTSGYEFSARGIARFNNVNPENLGASSAQQSIRADGVFAITNFDIRDRYIIDALVRNDGSSLFGEEERRQWYYRLAGAWRMAQEDWFTVPAVDEFKLRYAYGTAGGRPNFAAQYETFSVGGGLITPVALGNVNLKPEFSREHEAGIDAQFLDGRIGVGLTYANTTTEDQILQVPLPSYLGYANQWQNAGTLESNTYEATLSANLIQRTDFSWSARVLFDRTRSEITAMTVPAFNYGVAGQNLGNVFYAREGEELGTFYGIQAATDCSNLPDGLDCSEFATNDDGFLVWVGDQGLDSDNWGQAHPDGIQVAGYPLMWGTPFAGECDDRTSGERSISCPVGNSTPDYSMSLSSTMNWAGFSLYGLLDAVQGFDVYNQPLQWAIFAETAGIYDETEGPDAKPIGYYQALYNPLGGLAPNSYFVEDGSFVKLREVAVSYGVRGEHLAALPVLRTFSGLTLSLTGRNLATWTDYRGFDPEVGKSGGDTGSAALARVEGFQYPNFRTWTLGVEMNF